MDPATLGVLGSLGGVLLGAATSQFQASRTNKWQLRQADRQSRRELYGRFLSALHGVFVPALTVIEHPETEAAQEARTRIGSMFEQMLAMSAEVTLIATKPVSDAVDSLEEPLIAWLNLMRRDTFDEDAKRRILNLSEKITRSRNEMIKVMQADLKV